jgi:hypothetical protein
VDDIDQVSFGLDDGGDALVSPWRLVDTPASFRQLTPKVAASSSATVKRFFAPVRDIRWPAPCDHDMNDSRLQRRFYRA